MSRTKKDQLRADIEEIAGKARHGGRLDAVQWLLQRGEIALSLGLLRATLAAGDKWESKL